MPGLEQREHILAIHLLKHMNETQHVAVEPSIAQNVNLLTGNVGCGGASSADGNGGTTSADRPLKVNAHKPLATAAAHALVA